MRKARRLQAQEEEEVAAARAADARQVAEARAADARQVAEDAELAKVLAEAPPENRKRKAEREPAPALAEGEWVCTECTFINKKTLANVCEMCEQPRDKAAAAAALPTARQLKVREVAAAA